VNLTLDIISGNAQSLGPERRKVFGPEGGRIGRAPDCDWVLANPYVSRHHATIRWISGTYYIESTGENGVALGGPQAVIPKLERRPLKHGDHVFIDEYEMVVALEGIAAQPAPAAIPAAPAGGFAPADDPFDLVPTRQARILVDPLADPLVDPLAGPLAAPLDPAAEELDPLKQFGAPPRGSPVVTAPRQEASWNHTPGVSDHFAPPPPAAASPAGPVIPDDWDATTFGRARAREGAPVSPAASPAAAARPAVPPAGAIPDDWDKTNFARKSAPAPAPTPAARPQPANPIAARRPVPVAAGAAGAAAGGGALQAGAPPPGARPIARPAGAAAPARTAPPAAASPPAAAAAKPAQPPDAPGGFDVTALLKAAGVDPASLPPDTDASLGLILRSVVQGVIDVLRARAEIKEQFRLSQTIVKTAENNPLKFAVNAEDALASLLGRRNPAYLPPVEAFEDAFSDIRFHQLAMLAGMRAGFDHVLSRFDPQQLQEGFDKRARRGALLPMAAKSRYWEQFAEEFQELAGDRERAFRRLFAEEFALAYEKQLEQLKRTHNKPRR
jgi:type VI secretion system protein ImpI